MEAKEYVLRLPLQQMVLRKTAILLWNRFCSDSLGSSKQQKLEFLVEEVKKRVPLLFLPSSLEYKLVDLLLPIGKEIQIWKGYHQLMLSMTVATSEIGQLCWTSHGTVDYRKTAERLIRLEKVNNVTSYKLSCLYCLDNDVRKLWEGLNKTTKKYYYNDKNYHWCRRPKLVSLWAFFLNGNTNFIISQYRHDPRRTVLQHAFESAALSGNKTATEYFFQKLTLEERESFLVETAQRVIRKRCFGYTDFPQDFPPERFSDVVIYLLSQMSQEEQTDVFKRLSYATLACFLDWPWQDLFLNIAERMWAYLSTEEYRGLLTMLSDNDNNPGLKYEYTFIEFFRKSPNHFRNGLIMDCPFVSSLRNFISPIRFPHLQRLRMEWFCNLIKTDKSKCIKLVLRSINSLDRERLIISKLGVGICKYLVSRDKWFLLEMFFEECALSIEAKNRLKSSLMQCYFKKSGCKTRLSVLREKQFLKMFSISVSISNKRYIEELDTEESASPKKKIIK